MKLQIGLTEYSPAWIQLLDQEKVSYRTLTPGELPILREEFPVVILSGTVFPRNGIQDYLNRGGIAIRDRDSAFSSNHPRLIKIDLSVRQQCSDWNSCEKKFSLDGTSVTEIVSEKPRHSLRRLVQKTLQDAFHQQGLPYAHLWYYPDLQTSLFGFRMDLDEHDEGDFSTVCNLVDLYRGSLSFFVNMKTYENLEEPLRRLTGLGCEIASHGYIHHVYDNERQNEFNVAKAETLLRHYVSSLQGFAGPHGKWHPSLQRVLEKRGYVYSSEFTLDYDNLPFYPLIEGGLSPVLQIPTHPICEGVFLERYPFDEGMLDRYFSTIIEYKLRCCEPILFFGHPDRRLGRYPQILKRIYHSVEKRRGLWKTEFRNFAKWWKERHGIHFAANFSDGGLTLTQRFDHPQAAIRLVFQDGKTHLISGYECTKPWRIQEAAPSTIAVGDDPSPVVEERVRHPFFKRAKLAFKKILDWEIKTPLEDFQIKGLRSHLKHFLRSLYDRLFRFLHLPQRGSLK